MTAPDQFMLDGRPLPFQPGDTVLQAAHRAGVHLAHLCWHPRLGPSGACRLCTVVVDGRHQAACTTRAAAGQQVEHRTAALEADRRALLQMLFVEGNHFCPSCEKSGQCRLQAEGQAAGMTGPHWEEFTPQRRVDASHPDVWLDFNRCILCKLCVRASHEVDGKDVFAIAGHGIGATVIVNAPGGRLGDSAFGVDDFAASVCPVGAILPKRMGFGVPIGERRFDRHALGDPATDEEAPRG